MMATCWDIPSKVVYNRGIALRLIQPKSDKKAIMNKEEEKGGLDGLGKN